MAIYNISVIYFQAARIIPKLLPTRLSPARRAPLPEFQPASIRSARPVRRVDFGGIAAASLLSVVLFGSAAEGKLRATSDVNLILVLSAFEQVKVDPLRQPLRIAQAAIKLQPMFLLKAELPRAARSFAPKFADILRRRVIPRAMVRVTSSQFAGIRSSPMDTPIPLKLVYNDIYGSH
jgi:predicted nucleotidyltransferase